MLIRLAFRQNNFLKRLYPAGGSSGYEYELYHVENFISLSFPPSGYTTCWANFVGSYGLWLQPAYSGRTDVRCLCKSAGTGTEHFAPVLCVEADRW